MQRHPSPACCWIVASALILFACDPPENKSPDTPSLASKNPAEEALTSAPEYSPAWLGGDFGFVSILAPDGAYERLQIIKHDVDVALVGRIARTTVEQVFKNHTLTLQQGIYTFELPRGARVTSLTVSVGDEAATARVVEDKRVLPAPVEQLPLVRSPDLALDPSRETFSLEIASIAPGRTATVSLTYDRVLEPEGERVVYRYEMPALDAQDPSIPRIPSFHFDLSAPGARDLAVKGYNLEAPTQSPANNVSLARKRFVPLGSIEVSKALPRERAHVLRAAQGDAFLLDLVLEPSSDEKNFPEDLILALDTSAGSGQKALDRSVAFAKSFLAALEKHRPNANVTILESDLTTRTCAARGSIASARGCLDGLRAGGASDLGALAASLRGELASSSAPTHVIYFGDGKPTIGEVDDATLMTAFADAIGTRHRLHTVSVGQRSGASFMRALAARNAGFFYTSSALESASTDASRVLDAISRPTIRIERVEVSGGALERAALPTPFTLIPGEPRLITGRASKGSTLIMHGMRGGQPFEKKVALTADAADISEAVAKFEAQQWLTFRAFEGAAPKELVSISTEGQVPGPHTTLVTIENREASAGVDEDALERIRQHTFAISEIASVAKPKQASREPSDASRAPKEKTSDTNEIERTEKEEPPSTPEDAVEEEPAVADDEVTRALVQASPLVSATCSAPRIANKMKARQAMLSTCFRGQATSKIKPSGRVAFSWEVDLIGRADKVSMLESSIENKLVLRCLERVIERTRFENQDDYCVVVQAFSYQDDAKQALSSRAIVEREVNDLEARSAELSMDEDILLLEKLVLLGERERAVAWLERLKERHANRSLLLVLRSPITQEYFDREFRDAVRAVLGNMKAGNLLASRVAVQLTEREAVDEFLSTFASGRLDPAIAAEAVDIMSTRVPSIVPQVWGRWEDLYPPKRRYGMFLALEDGKKRWPEIHLRALLGLEESSDLTRVRHEEALELVITLQKQKDHAALFAESCASNRLERGWCLVHMDAFSAALGVEQFDTLQADLKRNQRAELDALRARRSVDMGNETLILRMARLHDELGEKEQALRVLSELVEFAPDASIAHQRHAVALEERGAITQACAAYGRAFQLDPRREVVSSAWERLFITHPDHTDELQKCVVRTLGAFPVTATRTVIAFAYDTSKVGTLGVSLAPATAETPKLPEDATRAVNSMAKTSRGFSMLFVGELPEGSYEISVGGAASRGEIVVLGEDGKVLSRAALSSGLPTDPPKKLALP